MNNMSGFNRGGFQQPMTGGFQGSGMGFQTPVMGGMQPYGGFQNRGGMAGGMRGGAMGMRGGRGGMSNGMMGMPMGAMGMGAMGMNMPQMGGAMAMQGMPGFSTQSHFTPAKSYGSPATHSGYIAPVVPSPTPMGSTAPKKAEGLVSRRNSNPSTAWASYTQYSLPSTNPSPSFASQATYPGTFSSQSTTLKRESSMIGNQAHFNPAFFPQGQQAGGDGSWNPHGAKRTRQE